ncbi:S46 family peptidase [Halosquirtibacter laminarini]|uniref:S46 family peptidase n=1 Tax=Halosquirtibacter laminarini TaxID=3374600 RepID=A0AC61NKF0_9BACT|nr:S46 family peptidase [Prolixibacteraceae bacterium]
MYRNKISTNNLKQLILAICIFALSWSNVHADEGMWIPTLLEKYNMEDLQKLGFKLSAEDIFSVNHASLKDAVVLFGTGCTGEVISSEGLVLTNHHCGYASIQALSSVEHNYLKQGYWAKGRDQELSANGLKVRFLERMEDVTKKIVSGMDGLNEEVQKDTIQARIQRVVAAEAPNKFREAVVKPILYGNQYFLYVYKVYRDIRLVGAPPSSIGKFGGDTDNWVWPRHTGDFSIFRIYSKPDGSPSDYDENNIPLETKTHLKIKLGDLKPDEPTMVMGYPGTTQLYLPSQAIHMYQDISFPTRISIRDIKLSTWKHFMDNDQKVEIQYASKYAHTANGWKKWQGAILGLSRYDAIQRKKEQEKAFNQWVSQDPNKMKMYGTILSDFDSLYEDFYELDRRNIYYQEVIERGSDIFQLAKTMNNFVRDKDKGEVVDIDAIQKKVALFFKDYNADVDCAVLTKLLNYYFENLTFERKSKYFHHLENSLRKDQFKKRYYDRSFLSDKQKVLDFIANYKRSDRIRLKKDPIFHLKGELDQDYIFNYFFDYQRVNNHIQMNQKLYVKALKEMNGDRRFKVDANLTMRIAYGKVEGYSPKDGVVYEAFTTLKGVYQKSQTDIADYQAPAKLISLYKDKNYGDYANSKGEMPVAFCASNHTTGGNSGSPVLNRDGYLIGVNFDRCWDGTMSDLMFDPTYCRNIILDIRYVLFVIDKFADAPHLIEEMDIVR